MKKKTIYLAILAVSTVFVSCTKTPVDASAAAAIITAWKDSVMGAIYNASSNNIAYGKADANGIFKIFLCNADGSNSRPLLYSAWQTNRHQWPEEWSADGQYLFCYVEKNNYALETGHTRIPDDAIPGYGGYTDIWAIKKDGSQAWQLTDLPNDYSHGIAHAAISTDGTLFTWSERTQAPNPFDLNLFAGGYVFRTATVDYLPVPAFSSIHSYEPGNLAASGEVESIAPDKTNMLLYSTFETKNIFNTPVYKLNLASGATTQLTTVSYAQSPTYTPNGKHIIFMTGRDCDIFPQQIQGSDWWIMNADGTNQKRLTYMNVKDHLQSVNKYRLAGSLSFLSDTSFLGGVMVSPLGLQGNTVKVNFSAFIK
ncbi:MAG: hypothetical protein ABI813_03635 [Bacteroidota bacterium]